MHTIPTQRVRRLAHGFVIAVSAFRRRVAVAAAGAAMVGGSLLAAQPVAADTTYPVNVTFDNVRFTMLNDGCTYLGGFDCPTDYWFELYGVVGAYTTAGASSAANGLPYRLFGKWGEHPCDADWTASYGMTCTKYATVGTNYDFGKTYLCNGSYYQTCSTSYSKSNNTIPLQVRPGEQFKVTALMQDYDALSANDTTCNGNLWFGPYTAAELQAMKFVTDAQNKQISMGYNGDGECIVHFHLS